MSDFAILDRGGMALPSTSSKGQFLRTDSVTGATTLWDGVTSSLTAAMVANAAAIAIDDSGVYTVDITGALTAQGALTATLAVPTDSTTFIFDNATTGGFPVVLNGLVAVPPGRSIWYWNGATFENASTSFVPFTVAMVANAAQFTFPNYRSSLLDISGALTANGNITATMPANAGLMIFDNATTGNFILQVNATYTLPRGRSIWYWNGATLEMVAQNNAVISGTLDLGARVPNVPIGASKLLMNTLSPAPTTQKGGITDAANSRFVIPVGGDGSYRIECSIGATSNAAGQLWPEVHVNAVNISSGTGVSTPAVGNTFISYDSEVCDLKAGDIVELYVNATVNACANVELQDTFISMTKLGAI